MEKLDEISDAVFNDTCNDENMNICVKNMGNLRIYSSLHNVKINTLLLE